MGSSKLAIFLLLTILLTGALTSVVAKYRGDEEDGEEEVEIWSPRGRSSEKEYERRERDFFLLQDSKRVFRTEAGEMRIVRSFNEKIVDKPMHIGFITMEPKTLFVPQYVDSNLIIFIRRGEAKLGAIHKHKLVERQLKNGDIYRVTAGSAFYMENTGESQRLHVICSIETSDSLGVKHFQSFFIGGGTNTSSMLTGFKPETLATAFNVTGEELREMFVGEHRQEGPVVYIGDNEDAREPSAYWSEFLKWNEEDRRKHLDIMLSFEEEEDQTDDDKGQDVTWSWKRFFLPSILWMEEREKNRAAPKPCNLYDRKPDFTNHYGWSVALDDHDYKPLRHSGVGLYLVRLTAGSMMAPHVNPTATEYGIVLRGSGTIQIGYPNGSIAMDAKVKEGDVFWVPRYFPFCQIASHSGAFEFFGFTTSARRNRPQFLAGQNSVLHALMGRELAASFGVSDERLRSFLNAQREAVILPTPSAVGEIENHRHHHHHHHRNHRY